VIRASYAAGQVTCGSLSAGGLVGTLDGKVEQSYATGLVAVGGGLIGVKNSGGRIIASYWDTEASGQTESAGGKGLTTAQLKSGLPAGFDPTIWGIIPGVSYPYLFGHGWLDFPVANLTAYDAPISAVMDHAGTPLDLVRETRKDSFYKKDDVVLAYTARKLSEPSARVATRAATRTRKAPLSASTGTMPGPSAAGAKTLHSI
jgi:hypothetical protein